MPAAKRAKKGAAPPTDPGSSALVPATPATSAGSAGAGNKRKLRVCAICLKDSSVPWHVSVFKCS